MNWSDNFPKFFHEFFLTSTIKKIYIVKYNMRTICLIGIITYNMLNKTSFKREIEKKYIAMIKIANNMG